MTKIAIIYYSTHGHVVQLAKALKQGVEKVAGATGTIYQVPETLDEDVLAKVYAPPKEDFPIATPEILTDFDGILFGFPTRFGSFPAQMKSFWDATGGLWARGALTGKTAGLFFSTGIQGDGQESTAFTALNHGMTYVLLGYRSPHLFNMEEIHSGSCWGTGTLAGADGKRQATKLELEIADVQGQSFAEVTKKLAA